MSPKASHRLRHRIGQIFADDERLAEISANTKRLNRANEQLAQLLDPVICEHAQVAKLSADELVIVVDASVWAGRIRYLAPQVGRHFAAAIGCVPKVTIKVRTPPSAPPRRPRAPLDEQARAILAQTAEQVDDTRLKRALERLAKHSGKES